MARIVGTGGGDVLRGDFLAASRDTDAGVLIERGSLAEISADNLSFTEFD